MRAKIRMSKTSSFSVKIESNYITVSGSEYWLMNFLGYCLHRKICRNSISY